MLHLATIIACLVLVYIIGLADSIIIPKLKLIVFQIKSKNYFDFIFAPFQAYDSNINMVINWEIEGSSSKLL